MRALLITLSAILVPSVAHAGIVSLLKITFGPDGPLFPVTELMGIGVGRWVALLVCSVVNASSMAGKIDLLCKCGATGIVLWAVIKLLDQALNIMGV